MDPRNAPCHNSPCHNFPCNNASAPPARNPFATRFFQPGAIAFHFGSSANTQSLVDQLIASEPSSPPTPLPRTNIKPIATSDHPKMLRHRRSARHREINLALRDPIGNPQATCKLIMQVPILELCVITEPLPKANPATPSEPLGIPSRRLRTTSQMGHPPYSSSRNPSPANLPCDLALPTVWVLRTLENADEPPNRTLRRKPTAHANRTR